MFANSINISYIFDISFVACVLVEGAKQQGKSDNSSGHTHSAVLVTQMPSRYLVRGVDCHVRELRAAERLTLISAPLPRNMGFDIVSQLSS